MEIAECRKQKTNRESAAQCVVLDERGAHKTRRGIDRNVGSVVEHTIKWSWNCGEARQGGAGLGG